MIYNYEKTTLRAAQKVLAGRIWPPYPIPSVTHYLNDPLESLIIKNHNL